MTNRSFKILSHACRIIFALTFIFSGFVKSIDPWGTAMNIHNYLISYNLEALFPVEMPFSIWLCGAELMMGLMLLLKVRIRLISIFAVIAMTFFTVLTFLSATVIPVEDCGCFGEVIKLTPWKTFLKNLILLPMAFCFFWRYRKDRIFSFSKREATLTGIVFLFAMGIGIYSYLHLPLIDFLPYKVGVNIPQAMEEARESYNEDQVIVVYRNRKTGKLKEFSISDEPWHNEEKWEWVETKIIEEEDRKSVEPMILEFHISAMDGEDVTEQILSEPNIFLICLQRPDISEEDQASLKNLIEYAERRDFQVVCLTPHNTVEATTISFLDSAPVLCCTMDSKTMKTMLRAQTGYVLLRRGTIVEKKNVRDI